MACCCIDVFGDGYDPWSETGKALRDGELTTGEYYYNVLHNFISLGVYSQEQAVYAWLEGRIPDSEMQQIVGGIAFFQLFSVAAIKYGPNTEGTPRAIPKDSYPKPPGWTGEWDWVAPMRNKSFQWRWRDPQGGEWRYHFLDKDHPVSHWDYNPWDHPYSQWQNLPDPTGGATPPTPPLVRPNIIPIVPPIIEDEN